MDCQEQDTERSLHKNKEHTRLIVVSHSKFGATICGGVWAELEGVRYVSNHWLKFSEGNGGFFSQDTKLDF